MNSDIYAVTKTVKVPKTVKIPKSRMPNICLTNDIFFKKSNDKSNGNYLLIFVWLYSFLFDEYLIMVCCFAI